MPDTDAYVWTRADADLAKRLLSADCADDTGAALLGDIGESGLQVPSEDAAHVFLLLVAVTLGAARLGRSRDASRDDAFWGRLVERPATAAFEPWLATRIGEFVRRGRQREGRPLPRPGPPRSAGELATAVTCCNNALDDAVARTWLTSSWERTFRIQSKLLLARRIPVACDYYRAWG